MQKLIIFFAFTPQSEYSVVSIGLTEKSIQIQSPALKNSFKKKPLIYAVSLMVTREKSRLSHTAQVTSSIGIYCCSRATMLIPIRPVLTGKKKSEIIN